jgi:hypothetical protein
MPSTLPPPLLLCTCLLLPALLPPATTGSSEDEEMADADDATAAAAAAAAKSVGSGRQAAQGRKTYKDQKRLPSGKSEIKKEGTAKSEKEAWEQTKPEEGKVDTRTRRCVAGLVGLVLTHVLFREAAE